MRALTLYTANLFDMAKKDPKYDFVIASDITTLKGLDVLPTCEEIKQSRKK